MYAAFVNPIRKTMYAAAIGVTLFGAIGSAHAQQIRTDAPLAAQSVTLRQPTTGVSSGDCSAFRSYIADEVRDQPKGSFSPTFLRSILRFTKAGCAATDTKGDIQIITETEQDDASLRTALRRMGTIDIIGLSGVTGCDRPPNGVCPTKTGAAANLQNGG